MLKPALLLGGEGTGEAVFPNPVKRLDRNTGMFCPKELLSLKR